MRRFVVTLALVLGVVAVLAPPATAQSGNVLVAEGVALPRDHQYERYDPAGSTYSRVDVNQVPGLIKQKAWIYDRTAKDWVFRPQQGLNPTYSASSSTAASGGSGNSLRTDNLVLPRDHQYERYDPAAGTYSRVDVNQVPNLVRQNQHVYDRTDRVWVHRPGQGVEPRYAAGTAPREGRGSGNRSDFERVTGTVQKIQGNQVTIRTDDNRTVVVDASQARQRTSDQITVGERVSAIGFYTAPDRLTARAIRDFRGGQGQAAKGDGWERIHGVVQSVQGSTMRLRTDDGRTLNVDMSKVGGEIQRALTQGEGATVIGYEWLGPNQLRAEYIQQDSSDPSRGGRVVGQAPAPAPASAPDGKGWQRIHGKVAAVSGGNLDLKADDGRNIVVDIGQVNPDVVKSLSAGESVTVIGTFRGTTLAAQYIQKDSSDASRPPAALPRQ